MRFAVLPTFSIGGKSEISPTKAALCNISLLSSSSEEVSGPTFNLS